MREILFRGKKRDNGEWAYGDLCQVLPGCECKFNLIFFQDEYATSSIVLPETVGQYTGLTDKNGKKIFEGDIFTDGVLTWQVSFKDGTFGACFGGEFSPIVLLRGIVDDEVIGNIHDNPELLGVEE